MSSQVQQLAQEVVMLGNMSSGPVASVRSLTWRLASLRETVETFPNLPERGQALREIQACMSALQDAQAELEAFAPNARRFASVLASGATGSADRGGGAADDPLRA